MSVRRNQRSFQITGTAVFSGAGVSVYRSVDRTADQLIRKIVALQLIDIGNNGSALFPVPVPFSPFQKSFFRFFISEIKRNDQIRKLFLTCEFFADKPASAEIAGSGSFTRLEYDLGTAA